MKKSEITQILGNLREKNDAIDKLVSEIAGYEDRLKLSVIREKFNAVLSLVEKYGKVPGEVKAVTETAPATTLTNASEAPEIALTASSDALMSNVSETPKERGEDAENASYQTVTHTDLLDVSERDLSVERVETYLKIA